jgi:hypothetical protein
MRSSSFCLLFAWVALVFFAPNRSMKRSSWARRASMRAALATSYSSSARSRR